MYYSLTFGREKNTWADWGLIPTSPPMISPPQPNRNLVNIPGRVKGPIDLSRAVFGYLTYPRVSGSWSFIREEEDPRTRIELYEEIRQWLHGRSTYVQTEDDPFHLYYGAFTIGEPTSGPNTVGITIQYDLEPVRYNLDGTVDETYLLQ